MITASIARRYGKALFELAEEEGRFEEIGDTLSSLSQAIRDNAELEALLCDPVGSRDAMLAVVEALGTGLELDPLLQNLLRLMAGRRRLHALADVASVYAELADRKVGRVRARVTSATELPEEILKQIRTGLERATAKQVVADRAVDPRILGGVVAQIGSTVFDGSLKAQLEDLGKQLKAQR